MERVRERDRDRDDYRERDKGPTYDEREEMYPSGYQKKAPPKT